MLISHKLQMILYGSLPRFRSYQTTIPFRWGLIAQTVSYILRRELCFSPESPGLVVANQHIPANQPSFHEFRWNRLIHPQDIILIWTHFYRSTLNTPLFIVRGERNKKETNKRKQGKTPKFARIFICETNQKTSTIPTEIENEEKKKRNTIKEK